MHWFESQVAALDRLAAVYVLAQQQSAADIVSVSEDIRIKRGQFIDAVQELVSNIIKVKGVSACAAYHEGLILASSGQVPHSDALGAMIQESVGVARNGSGMLSLGDIQQIVIVGAANKVAMLSVGPIMLCIVSPKNINLASTLSRVKI
ncbi:MAG: roadblock/LC7 domain-containing protein [Methylomonas sp.]